MPRCNLYRDMTRVYPTAVSRWRVSAKDIVAETDAPGQSNRTNRRKNSSWILRVDLGTVAAVYVAAVFPFNTREYTLLSAAAEFRLIGTTSIDWHGQTSKLLFTRRPDAFIEPCVGQACRGP